MIEAAIYGSHDATMCIQVEGETAALSHFGGGARFYNFEFERYFNDRFMKFPNEEGTMAEAYQYIADLLAEKHGIKKIDRMYWQLVSRKQRNLIKRIFKVDEFVWQPHHPSHAMGALMQSPFDEAIVFSVDGGGPDKEGSDVNSALKIFKCNRKGEYEIIAQYPWNLGIAYGMVGYPIAEIKKPVKHRLKSFLSMAGKVMGLSAYGENTRTRIDSAKQWMMQAYPMVRHERLMEMLAPVGEAGENAYDGSLSRCLASAIQAAFEEIMLDLVRRHAPPNYPICLTGGCALNAVANERIRREHGNSIYVPPAPNDAGIPFGMLCLNKTYEFPVDLRFSGYPILDYEAKYNIQNNDYAELAADLFNGKMIGFIRGQLEHGPRALGHRSILASPLQQRTRDDLNKLVKHREMFRPYAPVVRAKDAYKYFEFDHESPYMSFAPKIRSEHRDYLQAVCHVDGTARLQTVTEEQDPFLWHLLGEFEKLSKYPILLNTSLNGKGKPIVARVKDAQEIPWLHGIVAENNYIKKGE